MIDVIDSKEISVSSFINCLKFHIDFRDFDFFVYKSFELS